MSAYEWRVIRLTCPTHPGVNWEKPAAWSELPPCFICEPAWWAEHVPPPANYQKIEATAPLLEARV